MTYQLNTIGKVKNDENGAFIQLEPEYIPGLRALDGFSTSMCFGGSANVTMRRTGMNCRPGSPTMARLKSWAYLRRAPRAAKSHRNDGIRSYQY